MKKARFYYPKPVEFIDGAVFPDTDNIIINPKKLMVNVILWFLCIMMK